MNNRGSSLAGKLIVVTRARSQAGSLVRALIELGAEVLELPTIEIVPVESHHQLDKVLREITRYQWLVVTSANTVRVLVARLAVLGLSTSALGFLRKAAIGEATAQAMREQGIDPDVIPQQYLAESLVESLGSEIAGSRVLIARASVARDVIPDELSRKGARVDVVDAYRTITPDGASDRLQYVFASDSRPPDAVTFTSSSTVKNFLALWQCGDLGKVPAGLKAISIGPITSATLREAGWEPASEANKHDVEGMIDAVMRSFR